MNTQGDSHILIVDDEPASLKLPDAGLKAVQVRLRNVTSAARR